MNVVIVGPMDIKDCEHFHKWAQQYVKKDPKNRALIVIPRVDRQAVVRASLEAAQRATKTGWVIYAVGHGWGSRGQPWVANADLGPKGVMRVTEFVAFHNSPSTSLSGCEVRKIVEDLDEAKAEQEKNPKSLALKRWCKRSKLVPKDCLQLRKRISKSSVIQHDYESIARNFRANPVNRIILLACKVGRSHVFLDEISTDFGAPVGAYTRDVATRGEEHKTKGGKWVTDRVWVYLEGDEPGEGTNTDASLTELMPGSRDKDDLVWGEVVAESRKVRCEEE
jgi:hypothetical protein